jgi:hypothetical protein
MPAATRRSSMNRTPLPAAEGSRWAYPRLAGAPADRTEVVRRHGKQVFSGRQAGVVLRLGCTKSGLAGAEMEPSNRARDPGLSTATEYFDLSRCSPSIRLAESEWQTCHLAYGTCTWALNRCRLRPFHPAWDQQKPSRQSSLDKESSVGGLRQVFRLAFSCCRSYHCSRALSGGRLIAVRWCAHER